MHEVDVSKKGSTWGKEHSFQGGKKKTRTVINIEIFHFSVI